MTGKFQTIAIILIGWSLLMSSCKYEIEKPIPDKHLEQSQGKYEKYLNLLQEAYKSNNNFEAAVQLANLRASPKETFDLLEFSINENHENCDQIFEWYFLYDRHNFGVNILKLDTVKFKRAVTLCDNLNKHQTYSKYAQSKDEEESHAKESKEVEDSTNFNMELVSELKQIHEDDQEIRYRITAKNISLDVEKELSKEMHIIDSINLDKIDKIFNKYGYPGRELVGKDGNFTPALVIHHSNSLETRYKYLPFLEKAVEDGKLGEPTLNMIRRRIENMELDREK